MSINDEETLTYSLKLFFPSISLKWSRARTRNIYADIFEKNLIGSLEVSFSI